jgi:hypothetical protein
VLTAVRFMERRISCKKAGTPIDFGVPAAQYLVVGLSYMSGGQIDELVSSYKVPFRSN